MDRELRVQIEGWGYQKANLLLQAYRACVLSSIGSPLVSCWASASGVRMPFSVASLSARLRTRGNSMKSYSTAPKAPPIMGPTQKTCQKQNIQRLKKSPHYGLQDFGASQDSQI
ncbi:hypothetical protein EYF80_006800 [Liparis tanakae]|uniref:Uncharacterized protein n=1 Tax=Liparis tanakae TaxID=230148 RepID=A0A4Z2J069_9TELE|nr:hypothetical protein EYF80_006800 [Liparis tanakae]